MPAAVNAHSRLFVSVPLCLLALAIALVAFIGGRTELASKHSLKAAAKVRMSQLGTYGANESAVGPPGGQLGYLPAEES